MLKGRSYVKCSYHTQKYRMGGNLKVTDMFMALTVVIILQVYTYLQSHQIVYKYVQLFVYQFYLNKVVFKKIARHIEGAYKYLSTKYLLNTWRR